MWKWYRKAEAENGINGNEWNNDEMKESAKIYEMKYQ